MTKRRITEAEVSAALQAAAKRAPGRVDRRATGGLAMRYVENGAAACLGAVIMHDLGISIGQLRGLDREEGRRGGGIQLWASRHRVRRRFTAEAWRELDVIQKMNDRGAPWDWARIAAKRKGGGIW